MKYLFANWKMYLGYEDSVALASSLAQTKVESARVSVTVLPNYLATKAVVDLLLPAGLYVGAQNCAWVPKGAYTGAVSALLLKEIGCSCVLVGHSERRHIFHDSDTDVRKKIEAVLDVGMTPILCIGETFEEKESGKREYRLKKQLTTALDGLSLGDNNIFVAYEPVWAISGKDKHGDCLPADVDDIHGWIKQEIALYQSKDIPLIYGGSINQENVLSYASLPLVDGVLVGSMSTKIADLSAIIRQMSA